MAQVVQQQAAPAPAVAAATATAPSLPLPHQGPPLGPPHNIRHGMAMGMPMGHQMGPQIQAAGPVVQQARRTDTLLALYILDYCKKCGYKDSAEAFRREAKLEDDKIPVDVPYGWLYEWFTSFWDFYLARFNPDAAADKAMQHYAQSIGPHQPGAPSQLLPQHTGHLPGPPGVQPPRPPLANGIHHAQPQPATGPQTQQPQFAPGQPPNQPMLNGIPPQQRQPGAPPHMPPQLQSHPQPHIQPPNSAQINPNGLQHPNPALRGTQAISQVRYPPNGTHGRPGLSMGPPQMHNGIVQTAAGRGIPYPNHPIMSAQGHVLSGQPPLPPLQPQHTGPQQPQIPGQPQSQPQPQPQQPQPPQQPQQPQQSQQQKPPVQQQSGPHQPPQIVHQQALLFEWSVASQETQQSILAEAGLPLNVNIHALPEDQQTKIKSLLDLRGAKSGMAGTPGSSQALPQRGIKRRSPEESPSKDESSPPTKKARTGPGGSTVNGVVQSAPQQPSQPQQPSITSTQSQQQARNIQQTVNTARTFPPGGPQPSINGSQVPPAAVAQKPSMGPPPAPGQNPGGPPLQPPLMGGPNGPLSFSNMPPTITNQFQQMQRVNQSQHMTTQPLMNGYPTLAGKLPVHGHPSGAPFPPSQHPLQSQPPATSGAPANHPTPTMVAQNAQTPQTGGGTPSQPPTPASRGFTRPGPSAARPNPSQPSTINQDPSASKPPGSGKLANRQPIGTGNSPAIAAKVPGTKEDGGDGSRPGSRRGLGATPAAPTPGNAAMLSPSSIIAAAQAQQQQSPSGAGQNLANNSRPIGVNSFPSDQHTNSTTNPTVGTNNASNMDLMMTFGDIFSSTDDSESLFGGNLLGGAFTFDPTLGGTDGYSEMFNMFVNDGNGDAIAGP